MMPTMMPTTMPTTSCTTGATSTTGKSSDVDKNQEGASRRRPSSADSSTATVVSIAAVVLTGAIFGFFFAWVCSTMWGLDQADPRTAIEAMQQMNASVRNAVFFPAFFLTPFALGIAGAMQRARGHRRSAHCFLSAAGVYLVGGLVLTMMINVPMNEDLAAITIPSSRVDAEKIWSDYSGRWQFWNVMRTIASGVAVVLASIGLRASAMPER